VGIPEQGVSRAPAGRLPIVVTMCRSLGSWRPNSTPIQRHIAELAAANR
jgi:hypothetical protein